MVQHVSIQSADTHEPKHITAATVVDAGKVITPSGSVNGESELRRLNISDVETDGYTSPFSFWATYQDNQYTEGSPRSITGGVRTLVSINGLGSQTDTAELPGGIDLWGASLNLITPENERDAYAIRLNYKCSTTATGAYVDNELDIGGAVGVAIQETRPVLKASDATNRVNVSWPVYVGSTFITNGGELYITPSDDTDFWDFRISIFRIHQGQ